jgi:hypothetical protein
MAGFSSDPPLRNFIEMLQKKFQSWKHAEVLADIIFPLRQNYAFCSKNTFLHTSRAFIIFC